MNSLLFGTALEPLAVLHECSHLVLGLRSDDCTAHTEARDERDVWLASALIAVSSPLTASLYDGSMTAAEIAARCRVPEPLVLIRAGLAVVIGERQGSLGDALDLIRHQLARLETWIDDMKAWLCRRVWSA